MLRVVLLATFALARFDAPLYGQDGLAASAQKKFDRIADGLAKPGSVISLSRAELNAWAQTKIPEIVPQGLRNPMLDLGEGQATGYAIVDFLKMRQAQGKETPWLISKLIEGERPLKVSVRITSANGKMTVYLTSIELSGASLSGKTLDFLISTFFRPLYPEAKINEPFDLSYGIDRVEVHPAGVQVFIKAR
jgi:hypothetical protein